MPRTHCTSPWGPRNPGCIDPSRRCVPHSTRTREATSRRPEVDTHDTARRPRTRALDLARSPGPATVAAQPGGGRGAYSAHAAAASLDQLRKVAPHGCHRTPRDVSYPADGLAPAHQLAGPSHRGGWPARELAAAQHDRSRCRPVARLSLRSTPWTATSTRFAPTGPIVASSPVAPSGTPRRSGHRTGPASPSVDSMRTGPRSRSWARTAATCSSSTPALQPTPPQAACRTHQPGRQMANGLPSRIGNAPAREASTSRVRTAPGPREGSSRPEAGSNRPSLRPGHAPRRRHGHRLHRRALRRRVGGLRGGHH